MEAKAPTVATRAVEQAGRVHPSLRAAKALFFLPIPNNYRLCHHPRSRPLHPSQTRNTHNRHPFNHPLRLPLPIPQPWRNRKRKRRSTVKRPSRPPREATPRREPLPRMRPPPSRHPSPPRHPPASAWPIHTLQIVSPSTIEQGLGFFDADDLPSVPSPAAATFDKAARRHDFDGTVGGDFDGTVGGGFDHAPMKQDVAQTRDSSRRGDFPMAGFGLGGGGRKARDMAKFLANRGDQDLDGAGGL
jgi:hypothetical protein